jgi:hypothetical protein
MMKLSDERYASIRPLISNIGQEYEAGDPKLVSEVRNNFLLKPSTEEYNLETAPGYDTSMGQADAVRQILNNQVH